MRSIVSHYGGSTQSRSYKEALKVEQYDTEYVSELAREGKAADNDGDGSPMHYLLKYDDGDEQHISWRAIQVGIRNITSGGFIDVAHQHPLPRLN